MIQGIEKAAETPTPNVPGTAATPQVPGFMDWMAENANKVIPAFGLSGENAGQYGAMGGAGLGAGGAFLLHMLMAKKKNRKISDYIKSMLLGSLLGGGLGYFGGPKLAPAMKAQAAGNPELQARAIQQAMQLQGIKQDPLGKVREMISPAPTPGPAQPEEPASPMMSGAAGGGMRGAAMGGLRGLLMGSPMMAATNAGVEGLAGMMGGGLKGLFGGAPAGAPAPRKPVPPAITPAQQTAQESAE